MPWITMITGLIGQNTRPSQLQTGFQQPQSSPVMGVMVGLGAVCILGGLIYFATKKG